MCSTLAAEKHHQSGSGYDREHLDALVIGLCETHHHDVHGLWRAIRIDKPSDALPGPAPISVVELTIRRHAAFVELWGRSLVERGGPLAPVGESLRAMSAVLEAEADTLAGWLLDDGGEP